MEEIKNGKKWIYTSAFKAIKSLAPSAVFTIAENDLDTIEWQDNRVARPTNAEITAKMEELEAEWNSNEEARVNRSLSYPLLVEQLDKLFHDIENDKLDKSGEFYTAIKSVKDKYPKE